MRRLARGQDGCKTIRSCGLPYDSAAKGRVLVEGGRVAPQQLQSCRMGLRCAYRSPGTWKDLGRRIDWYAAAHEAEGGSFAHSVLTVPHGRRDPLGDVLGRLSASWADLRNHAEYREARRALDATPVAVLQIKWSPRAGWHPHYHVLWFVSGEDVEGLGRAVAASWAHQTRRHGTEAGQVMTEMVQNRWGLWEYLSDESERHPTNDCLHKDHKGCLACQMPGRWRGEKVDPTPGPRYAPTPGPRYPTGFEIFSEIGAAAVTGSKVAQAVLAEYVTGTAGHGRVRKLGQLTRRFGSPPDEGPVRYQSGGPRMWIATDLVAAVELANRGTGSPLVGLEDPGRIAADWSAGLGRRIEIGAAPDDGAPLLKFATNQQ